MSDVPPVVFVARSAKVFPRKRGDETRAKAIYAFHLRSYVSRPAGGRVEICRFYTNRP
jgi:hypothetical protein